jgi:hypothetical protein
MEQSLAKQSKPLQFELSFENAVDKDLLVDIDDRDFGSENSIEQNKVIIDIGGKPIVRNLRTLYELKGVDMPPEMKIFDSYEIWLVSYSLNILNTGGFRKLKQVQLDISYQPLLDGQRPPVTIIDLLPQTKFRGVISGKLEAKASINLNGQLSVPKAVTSILKHTDTLSAGGKVEVGADADVVCNIRISILTTDIVSAGIGNSESSWILEKNIDNQLVGDQLCVQTILVPHDIELLPVKARVSAVVSGPLGLLPIRMQSQWEPFETILK